METATDVLHARLAAVEAGAEDTTNLMCTFELRLTNMDNLLQESVERRVDPPAARAAEAATGHRVHPVGPVTGADLEPVAGRRDVPAVDQSPRRRQPRVELGDQLRIERQLAVEVRGLGRVVPDAPGGGEHGGVRGFAIVAVGGTGVWWAGRTPDYELAIVSDSGLHQIKARLDGTARVSHRDLPSGTALAGPDLQPAGEAADLKRAAWQT